LRIHLIVQQAKCYLSAGEKKKGTELYEEAKALFDQGFADGIVKDASIVFPIISGLTLALKWGTIQDDEKATYEKNLVHSFIESARAYGDMAHVTRALALKGVMNQRLGLWDEALEAEAELEECYDVSLTSKICAAYGSDRAAQSITLAPQYAWVVEGKKMTQRVEEALSRGITLLERKELERRNVHNKTMMLYPLIVLWFISGEEDNMTRAHSLWQKHVVEAIEEFYDKESKIFFTALLKPMKYFLNLALSRSTSSEEVRERREFILDMMDAGSLENGTFQTMDGVLRLLGLSFKSLCCYIVMRDEEEDIKDFARWKYVNAWATGILVEEVKSTRNMLGMDVATHTCNLILNTSHK
jgi:hypothetical protein